MRTLTTTIAAIIITVMSFSSASAKTKTMTKDQFDMVFKGIDNNLVGTWEKNKRAVSGSAAEFCQFNASGTYIAFTEVNGKITVTGRGHWMVRDNQITISSGNEVSSKSAYVTAENQLSFGEDVNYSKPSAAYANK
jgi:hypothetical protein